MPESWLEEKGPAPTCWCVTVCCAVKGSPRIMSATCMLLGNLRLLGVKCNLCLILFNLFLPCSVELRREISPRSAETTSLMSSDCVSLLAWFTSLLLLFSILFLLPYRSLLLLPLYPSLFLLLL